MAIKVSGEFEALLHRESGGFPPKTPQKLKSEFRKGLPKLGFLFSRALAEHSVGWQRVQQADTARGRRLYPATSPDMRTDMNIATGHRSSNVGERLVLALLWCAWQA